MDRGAYHCGTVHRSKKITACVDVCPVECIHPTRDEPDFYPPRHSLDHLGAAAGYGKRLVLVSSLDNLLKGAAGQAVQNMNLMFGFGEAEGLL